MKKILFIGFLPLMILRVYGQINMNDSTVQVIGYWDNKENQNYVITHEQLKIKDSDTISRDFHKYAVDITIVDSTANSYAINWFYHDYEIQSDNETMKFLNSLTEDMVVSIITDELGVFKEVVNWKEIRDYIFKGLNLMKKEMKDIPDIDKIITQTESMFSTKQSIETAVINEIRQFHTFHGNVYKLGEEYHSTMQLPNLYGGEPFDTDIIVWLDEIDTDNNNYIIRMQNEVNSQQLTKATFDYLFQFAETMGVIPPKLDEIPPLRNETWTASRIHGSGWVIYSVQTREVSAEDQTTIKETIIEIQ